MLLKARGKINLGLDVTGVREDGYHLVRMVMQSVKLYDRLEINHSEEPSIQLQTNLHFLPTDERNLVYRAIKMLFDEFSVTDGVSVRLEKRIPVAAGMAGGSTDAAAAMVGINRMFRLGLKKSELMDRAVSLGADIPYCIMRGTALAEGIGEELTPLTDMPHCYIVLGKPGISVATKHVYEELDNKQEAAHPDIDGILGAVKARSLDGIVQHMGNVLEQVTIGEYPIVEQIKQLLLENGASGALMSGSGPTVFGIFKDKDLAMHACGVLKTSGLVKMACVTEPFANRR